MTPGDTPDDTVGEDGEVIPPTKYGRTGPPCFNPKTKSWRLRYLPPAVKPSPKQSLFLGTTCRELFYGGAAGGGKGLNKNTEVVTPHGFKPIGQLQVGNRVVNPDGTESKVVAVHHRGLQPCFEVTFSDGAKVTTDADHLWTYRLSGIRVKRDIQWKVATTPQLAEMVRDAQTAADAGKRPNWPNIPLAEPVKWTGINFRYPEGRWPIDPYALGVLIGDGWTNEKGAIGFASVDQQIVDAMTAWGESLGFRWGRTNISYIASGTDTMEGVRALKRALSSVGALGCVANNKFIPPAYMTAPIHIRQAIMQGLMDTDGTADSRGHASYTSVSKQLAEDVQFMARSLGHKATITERVGKYRDAEGEIVECQVAYTVTMTGRDATDLFRLERKRERCGAVQQPGIRRIVSIEPVDPEETVCITVDNPNGLFIAGREFIVTHNSVALLAAALQFADVPGYAALILRRNLTDLTQPGALISMSRQWLDGRSDCSYNANDRKWTFKGGGVIQFGYLSHIQDIGRYKGPLRPETEVLTDDGWTPICDVRVGDNVASFDPETRAAGMQPVSAVHEWDYDDDLVTVHQRTGVSFAATPDHTIWYRTAKLPELRRGRVGEVTATHGQIWIPRNGTWSDGEPPKPRVFAPTNLKGPKVPTLRFSPEDWVEFLGWYVSEGHLGIGKEKNLVGITQKMPEHQQRIEALLDRIGAKWHRYDNRHYSFSNGELADYLRDNCGKLAAGKRLPREVFSYAPEYRRILLDTLVDGDGSHYPDEGGKMLFVTTSEQLWNDVSELATRCGLTATTGTSPRMNFDGSERSEPALTYRVSITDRAGRDREVKQRDVHRERYTGKVHCLTVAPWHSIIIRYKGRVSVTGNTEYHYIGFDELSEFPVENMYTFMFSRLRRPAGLSRADIIQMYGQANDGLTLLDVPLRVRSASNPGGPGAGWAKKRFVDLQGRKAPFLPATFRDNPAIDDDEYLESLAMLDEVERRRLELGDWTIQEIPGALWKLADIQRHEWIRTDGTGMFDRVYIGLDPSVGEGAGDECGIVAGGILSSGRVVVLEDGSMSAHPDVWSARAVTMYTVLNATAIVVEQNNGAQLLRTQLRDAADRLGLPQPVVLLVTAKESKERRAGTVSAGYRSPEGNPLIVHAAGLAGGELEGQMVGWVPGQKQQTVKSPDRVDGLVWLLRGLLYPESIADMKQSVSTPGGLVDRYRSWG